MKESEKPILSTIQIQSSLCEYCVFTYVKSSKYISQILTVIILGIMVTSDFNFVIIHNAQVLLTEWGGKYI